LGETGKTSEGRAARPDALVDHRALVEQGPVVMYVAAAHDEEGPIYVSPQIERMLGYTPEEWLGSMLWPDAIHPDDRARILAAEGRHLASGEPWTEEYRLIGRNGRVVWVRDEAILVRDDAGGAMRWQGVMIDITDRKRTEQDLRESEAKYRTLVEQIPAVVYIVAPDDDRKTLYVNPQVEALLGYTRWEWLDQPDIWMELLHPDDREPTLAAHDLHNETGEPWNREYRLIASDGSVVWFRDVATLVRDEDGRPLFWQGVQLDITAQKRAEAILRASRDDLEMRAAERAAELEEANELLMLEVAERRRAEARLREAEAMYRVLVEQIPAMVFVEIFDQTGSGRSDLAYMSPQVEAILGYTPGELMGDPDWWERLLHPDDRQRAIAEAIRCDKTGEPFNLEYRMMARDGRVVWLHSQAVLVRDRSGRPSFWHGVALDVTARRVAEERLERVRALLDPDALRRIH